METRHEQPESSTPERVFARCAAVLVDQYSDRTLSFVQGEVMNVTDCGGTQVIVNRGETSITIQRENLRRVTATGPDAATAISRYVRDLSMAHGACTHRGL